MRDGTSSGRELFDPRAATALREALSQRAIARVAVVSPHLDDAAFSLATFLSLPDLPPRHVWTVFTEARHDADSRHSVATGFADAAAEHAARRDEDQAAMALLGVPYTHLGVQADRFDDASAEEVVDKVLRGAVGELDRPGRTLLLLPAGAGGSLPWWTQALRRLRREPLGCASHAEHVWVRDRMAQALRRRHRHPWTRAGGAAGVEPDEGQVVLGFYAEMPYLWADTPQALSQRLQVVERVGYDVLRWPVDAASKWRAAKAYVSQFESEFGTREDFQRRTLALPECIFLPRVASA